MDESTAKTTNHMNFELLFETDVFVYKSLRHGDFLYDENKEPVYRERHPQQFQLILKEHWENAKAQAQEHLDTFNNLSKEDKLKYLKSVSININNKTLDPDYDPSPHAREHTEKLQSAIHKAYIELTKNK